MLILNLYWGLTVEDFVFKMGAIYTFGLIRTNSNCSEALKQFFWTLCFVAFTMLNDRYPCPHHLFGKTCFCVASGTAVYCSSASCRSKFSKRWLICFKTEMSSQVVKTPKYCTGCATVYLLWFLRYSVSTQYKRFAIKWYWYDHRQSVIEPSTCECRCWCWV